MEKIVMVSGLGQLGSWVLEFLARIEGIDKIVATDIDEEWGQYRTNVVAVGSAFQGFSKSLEFRKNDVSNINETARIVKEIRPDVIVSCSSLGTPRELGEATLAKEIKQKLNIAGSGVWLPYHMLLPARLAQAIHKAGIQTHVVNCSFPDVVGPVIWKHFGYGPTVGAGNPDLVAGNITKYVSITEGVPVKEVVVYLVGSHALAERGSKEGIPFFLKIMVGDQDITHKYDTAWLTQDCMTSIYDRIAKGKPIPFSYIASSAVKNAMLILNNTNEFTHAPAPNGLLGGFPVRLSAKGAEVVLPKELSLEQALKINEEATKFDGVEKIENDGTVVYTDKTYSIMKDMGYDCRKLSFDELESRAKELKTLAKKLVTA